MSRIRLKERLSGWRGQVAIWGTAGAVGLTALGGAHAARNMTRDLSQQAVGFARTHDIPAGDFNAIQHCHASATLTARYGSGIAEFLGACRELQEDSATDRYKDLYNNAIGRQLARHAARSGREIDALILHAWRSGQLMTREDPARRAGPLSGGPDPAYDPPAAGNAANAAPEEESAAPPSPRPRS